MKGILLRDAAWGLGVLGIRVQGLGVLGFGGCGNVFYVTVFSIVFQGFGRCRSSVNS